MLEIWKLPPFLLASLILLLTPGPAVLYIVARSIDQGRAAGLLSVLSIETGNFFQVLAATFGLSALVLSSATLFSVVKYLGAAYLVYLGIRKWIMHEDRQEPTGLVEKSPKQVFSQGMTVAILNPKTALFFLAFLPQFVDANRGNIPLQTLELGIIFVLMGCITDSCYALMAGTARRVLRDNRRFWQAEKYIAGSVYVGLGMAAALAKATRK
jgi:threonine/homoserine/homoserine lactone efflux protein